DIPENDPVGIQGVHVRSTGEVAFTLSLARFRARAGGSSTFPVGFVRCELKVVVRVAGEELTGTGVEYLPVRRKQALVVCGPGSGAARLRAPRTPHPEAPAANEVERLRRSGKVLETADRARAAARFEFRTPDEFRRLLEQQGELPFLVVLHEV